MRVLVENAFVQLSMPSCSPDGFSSIGKVHQSPSAKNVPRSVSDKEGLMRNSRMVGFVGYNLKITEVLQMKNTKYHVYINSEERRLLISSLNDLRNRLIAEGKYTDLVDEVLIKAANAKIKKINVVSKCP